MSGHCSGGKRHSTLIFGFMTGKVSTGIPRHGQKAFRAMVGEIQSREARSGSQRSRVRRWGEIPNA